MITSQLLLKNPKQISYPFESEKSKLFYGSIKWFTADFIVTGFTLKKNNNNDFNLESFKV